LSSAKPICVEFYRRTSPITIVGDHTVRWAKQLPAAIPGGTHVERSPWHLCSVGYTIFIALLHDIVLRPSAAFSLGGKRIVTASDDRTAQLWNGSIVS
jgi:hypothetical protein